MSINRFNLISTASDAARYTGRLLYVSCATCDSDGSNTPHAHTCTELYYITGGQGSFFIEERVYPVEKGDLVIVNPKVQHAEIGDESHPLEYILLGVDGLELTTGDNEKKPFHMISFRKSEISLQPYLEEMLREMERKDPGHETVCRNLLEVFLIRVMRYSNYSARSVPSTRRISKECAAARRYIDEHFKESLSLDQLSAAVHINKYHLVHSFTKAYGVSPINYLISLRLQESRNLLQSTDLSMTQISQTVGFSSPCYFSQIFHKATGMSPREYRNTFRQGNG